MNLDEPDYGEAISIVSRDGRLVADMSGPMVKGVLALIMRVIHRLTMVPGSLFYASDTGENVLDLENSTEGDEFFSGHAARYAGEAEREQGVLAARCDVRRSATDPRRVIVSVQIDIARQTTGFTLIVSPAEAARVIIAGAP